MNQFWIRNMSVIGNLFSFKAFEIGFLWSEPLYLTAMVLIRLKWNVFSSDLNKNVPIIVIKRYYVPLLSFFCFHFLFGTYYNQLWFECWLVRIVQIRWFWSNQHLQAMRMGHKASWHWVTHLKRVKHIPGRPKWSSVQVLPLAEEIG